MQEICASKPPDRADTAERGTEEIAASERVERKKKRVVRRCRRIIQESPAWLDIDFGTRRTSSSGNVTVWRGLGVDGWMGEWVAGWGGVYSTLPFIHPRAPTGAHKPVFGIYKRGETRSRTHSTRMDDYESERVPWSPPTGTRCPPN